MEKTIQKIPFLRITFALAIGIVLGEYLYMPILLLLPLIMLTLIALVIINRFYQFRFNIIFGVGIHLLFIFIGIFLFQQYNTKPYFFEKEKYIATVLESPQEKPNSYKSIIQINGYFLNDSIISTHENIIVYFEKTEIIPDLKPGNIIVCNQTPQSIKNNGNPYEFDYKNYLERKKIYRQVYLREVNWTKSKFSKSSLSIFAENFREKLLTIYRNQPIDKTELEILSALTLGYKRDLEPETKRVFSSAGAMHILAVSGLHVGIIFWLISILFGFLQKQRSGKFIFISISILVLWGYAFITGLSPSVMRASTMFSIYIIGENLQRKTNIYNNLAASALFLLLLNPNSLFDVGFQLSYSAVFGIVFLQPKLSNLINTKNKIYRFFWSLLTVSVAAQIATSPLAIFYFNQIPFYFWLTNLIIIPSVMLLIPAGIALLLISKLSFLASVFAFIINHLIKSIYLFLAFIEKLPYSVIHFYINPIQLLFIIGILISIFLFIKNHRPLYIKSALLFVLLLSMSEIVVTINQLYKNEIIVFNNNQNLTIQLIHGKNNYIISENEIKPEDNIRNTILNANEKRGINSPLFFNLKDTIANENIYLKNGLIFFEGKFVLVEKKMSDFKNESTPDFLINPKYDTENYNLVRKKPIIITNKSYRTYQKDENLKIHYTYFDKAFVENW